jgi:polyhydroxyalkanoate synthesis repressor PhaR
MTKIIKRYANRKLYDTERSTYITLDEIKQMVKDGEDLRIIDNSTKEDLTNATLAQIIFEQEKSHKKLLPLSALRTIIQSGEDFVQKLQNPVTQFQDEVKKKANVIEEGGKAIRDFIDGAQRSLDEMQKRVDDRLRDGVDQLTHIPEMRRDMYTLESRILAIEESLRRIEKSLQGSEGPKGPSSDPFRDLP